MKRKNLALGMSCALAAASLQGLPAAAAFEQSVESSYNTAVQGQDALEGLDVTVTEKTVSCSTNQAACKQTEIRATDISKSSIRADISVTTDESTSEVYYSGGYYYTTTSEGKEKREMEHQDIWNMINSEVYLNMTSNYLKMLYSETDSDGSTMYYFAGTAESLGDYSRHLLNGAADGQEITIDTLTGSMEVDAQGHVSERTVDLVYTVTSGENSETFYTRTSAVFNKNGQDVTVELPDLSEYQKQESDKPTETITALERTIYTTEDVNVRAAGDLTAVILGGLGAGSGVTQTGYTSDGWIQIQYNGAVGYIWGDYVSTKQPVLTQNSSGTMYATTNVNVRQSYSSDSAIVGGLTKGQAVEVTGTTNNNWIRVKLNGTTGYVYADYLSWSEPIADNYVKDGRMTGLVTDASYGTLTIRRDNGETAIFNTTYATMNLTDNLKTGDWVEVVYSGSGTPYTATQVSSYSGSSGTAASSEEQSVSAEGVVLSEGGSTLVLGCSDGLTRIFDLTDTDIEMAGDLSEGQYVTVYWMSTTGGSEIKNIPALRVSG
jgi:uncharacterized protein YgiM (DUF1202 family)